MEIATSSDTLTEPPPILTKPEKQSEHPLKEAI